MSAQPPGSGLPPYHAASSPDPDPGAPKPRPLSVTLLAIIGILWGAMGTVCSPLALLPYFVSMGNNPAVDIVKGNSILYLWTILATLLTWGLAIYLLAASIGCFGLKPWARAGMVRYGVIALVLGVVSLLVNATLLFPRLLSGEGADAAQRIGGVVGVVVGLVFAVIGFVYCGLLISLMRRPHVIAAFEERR